MSALRLSDVDLESGLVLIACAQYQGKEGPPKGNESREFALPLESRAVLRAHLDRMAVERWPGWERLVFPRPQWPQARRVASVYWSSSTIDSKIRDSFKRLGFAVRGTTHAARHTLITVADGLSASESLLREVVGHRDRRVHEGYKGRRTARVISLADAVGGALLRGRTGTKTGTPGADSGEDR